MNRPDPVSTQDIQTRFVEDYPDVVQNPNAFEVASRSVDEIHKQKKVEAGYAEQEYDTYKQAGDHARHKNALKEMMVERGKDPDLV